MFVVFVFMDDLRVFLRAFKHDMKENSIKFGDLFDAILLQFRIPSY